MPDIVAYNQVMQQARQDPTVIKSPQRTASIRASSMPRLAVDPQVIKIQKETRLVLESALTFNQHLEFTGGILGILGFADQVHWIENICAHMLKKAVIVNICYYSHCSAHNVIYSILYMLDCMCVLVMREKGVC